LPLTAKTVSATSVSSMVQYKHCASLVGDVA